MNKTLFFTLTTLFFALNYSNSQSESLTSSPYSLYGLGVINQTSIGFTNAMGYSGIGIKTANEINNLNAANYALIPENSFFYDFGLKGEYNSFSNRSSDDAKTTFNFSNLAIAFRIAEGLGAGITMVPYSDIGYSLVGIQTNIEGSTQVFESSVTGAGGLSDLKLNLGYSVNEKLRFGTSLSVLFGNIVEEESFQISTTSFSSSETTNYTGARLGLGMQYDITDNITIGSSAQFPTALKGTLNRSVLKTLDGFVITVEDAESSKAEDFNLPLELGTGISARFLKSLTLSADYKKNYWSKTGQTENLGVYEDQDIYSFGLEYLKDPKSYKYWDRVRYRAGYNYDNGYLAINGIKIDGYNLTAGVGFPIGQNQRSLLNLSYSYGSKGQIENILVKENFHLLTINLSLENLWFQKRKIN